MPNELKPCPFCGSGVKRLSQMHFLNKHPAFMGRRAIICLGCGVIMLGNTEVDAKERWNWRADNGNER